MPDIVTHYLFAKKATKNMNENMRKVVKQYNDAYVLGSNGPDYFFYYHVLPYQIDSERNKITSLGTKMHSMNMNKLFSTMIEYVKYHYTDELYSYMLGFIMHYYLDRYCHPYIFYFSGIDHGTKETKIYSYYHKQMEIDIDCNMLELDNLTLKHVKPSNLLELKRINFRGLHGMVNHVLEEVYDTSIDLKVFKQCFKDFKTSMNLTYSSGTIKKSLVEKGEKLLKQGPFFSTAIYHSDFHKKDVLNLNRREWCNPCNMDEKYNTTFIEQFELGLEEVKKMLNCIDMYMNNQCDMEKIVELVDGRCFDTNEKEDVVKKYSICIYEEN